MGQSSFGQICWEDALYNYENVVALGSESMKLKATIKVAILLKQAPQNILAKTIPILAKLIIDHNSSIQPIQEVVVYCLKCIVCHSDGVFAAQIGQSGALVSMLKLLPQSSGSFGKVLVKCIWCLVNYGSENKKIVVRNGGLDIVVNMLEFCMDGRIKLYLLEILSAMALLKDVMRMIIMLGVRGLRFLVEAASCGSLVSRERACYAIGVIGIFKRARLMFVELGVMPVLVDLFYQGDIKTKLLVGNSLGVISAHVDSIRPLAQAGAIPLYAELLQAPDLIGKEIAEDVFCLLAVAENNAVAIAEHLVRILTEGDDGAKIAAVDVVWDLAGYKHSVSVVRNSGAIPILVELLRDGSSSDIKEKASGAIAQLSYDEENRAALADAGAVPILIELLRDELEDLRDNAAEALIQFSEDPWQRDAIAEAVEVPSFQIMQNRLAQIQASDEHMVRSLRRMGNEQLAWDPNLA